MLPFAYLLDISATPFILAFFLLGFFLVALMQNSSIAMGKYQAKLMIKKKKLFFFRPIFQRFFSKHFWSDLNYCFSLSKEIYLLLYLFCLFFFSSSGPIMLWIIVGLILPVLLDVLAYALASDFALRLVTPISSFYLTLIFPFTALLQHCCSFSRKKIKHQTIKDPHLKEQIKEIFVSDLHLPMDSSDLKRITSFITFRERVAKEVMVPRIDVTALSSDTPIDKAAQLFDEETYSRIPVFKDNLDHILGVLHYKDLLKAYIHASEKQEQLHLPLERLLKPVIFSPENKKITHLLQEFKAKQMHMAIVVDEYGGTEGILTIEDVLEELVGDIEDEYDMDEEEQFWKLPNGVWIVDAKMSLIDMESKLNIDLPEHPDYETVGGYIYHKAGTIPSKGWSIHLDKYTIEVLSSSERAIEKIRIIPEKKEG